MLLNRFFFIVGFFLTLCIFSRCDKDSPGVKNCRIKELYHELPDRYSYTFSYNNDGTLNSINSPNWSNRLEYRDGRVSRIIITTGNETEILSFEYPTDRLTKWTSSKMYNSVTREYYLYHDGDKIVFLEVVDPANPPAQELMEYRCEVRYQGDNVTEIVSTSDCCTTTYKDVEHDNGLNPATLLRQSTGVFTGTDIFDYTFFRFAPDMLSNNNPTRFTFELKDNTGYSSTSIYEYIYTYAASGAYPVELTRYVDGSKDFTTYHFVYENCD